MSARRLLCVAMTAAGTLLASASLAGAATLTVTTTSDSGPGSLRDTVAKAHRQDTIMVPAGTYHLASEIQIAKPLSLVGDSARTTVIDGGNATRLFEVGPTDDLVDFEHLTLTHGSAPSGGAISATSFLSLSNDTIVANTATTGSGGGVYASGPVFVNGTTVAGNRSLHGNGGGFELAPTGAYESFIRASTFSGNSAYQYGGGIDSSTGNDQTLTLDFNTLDGNSVTSTVAYPEAEGGNLYSYGGSVWGVIASTVTMYGNVFTHATAPLDYVSCQLTSSSTAGSGYNVEDADGGCIVHAETGDVRVDDPKLGPLANNGGDTDTLMPAADSPLVDVVPAGSICRGFHDQRFLPRPHGAACDMGSVER